MSSYSTMHVVWAPGMGETRTQIIHMRPAAEMLGLWLKSITFMHRCMVESPTWRVTSFTPMLLTRWPVADFAHRTSPDRTGMCWEKVSRQHVTPAPKFMRKRSFVTVEMLTH